MTRSTVLVYHADPKYTALVRAPRDRVVVRGAATASEAERFVAEADVLYAWQFPRHLYAKAERLRWLQVMGAGVDWALVPELPRDVTVTRAPGIFGPWMAEYTLGWCLWVTQRIAAYQAAQQRHHWHDSLLPERLGGKTLVIVGLGDIGRAIARGARALGMRVLGVSRTGRAVRGAERVYRMRALRIALRQADFAVVLLPLTPETRGVVDAEALAAMKPTAWLLNIARGAVVDEAALLEALRARRIAGAVLDVFATEPLPSRHPFWGLDNVALTPHISGPSIPEEIAPIFNDNLARWLARRPLRHVVDRGAGY